MQILGVYFVGIRGIVSLQDSILTRLRISLGWSFTSRICGFLSSGELWFHACSIPSLAGSCVLYLTAELLLFIRMFIYQLSYFLRLPWQSLQLCSSSFQVPLPLWVPSSAVYWFAWLSSSQNRPDIQKPLLISCWQTCASFPPHISLIWQFASSTFSLQRLSM